MRQRGLVIGVAVLLALAAAASVYLYVDSVREEAGAGVTVVVAKHDIIAGTDLDKIIADGGFAALEVPEDALVPNAVTKLSELEGRKNSSAIVAGEQIPQARLEGSGESVAGGTLGIAPGYHAVTLSLENPRVTGSFLRLGDEVSIYATFEPPLGEPTTVVLAPQVKVLRVQHPPVADATMNEEDSANAGDEYLVTLQLEPDDVQRFVFAVDEGHVYLSVVAPGDKVGARKPITVEQVAK